MTSRLALFFVCSIGCVCASQPTSLADLPDANPEAELKSFVVPEGFEVNLFAAEPMIQKPVQMNWDAQGRLWVVSSTTYPHIKPGEEAKDQVVVLEDTDGDGKADKSTPFADGLHIPTALAPGDGGLYVANSTEVLFLKDTNGDLKADERTIMLSGFGTEDTHHLLHTFRWGPEGMLYFLQSIYIHTHMETPHGIRRLMGGGVWEFRPETRRAEILSKGLINPWGFEFDRWGQSFACDGAGGEGINFIFPGSVFATSPGAKRILHGLSPGQPKQCGLEIVEDPHFPEDWQGSFVLNDFRGNRVNRFKLTPSGSSYIAKQMPDVLASTHRAFRPIDVKVGPDGALYIADWYNPIIQHGEVDFRDPRRDHQHGRIWRVTAKGRPLSPKPKIAGASTGELLEMLKSDRAYVRRFAKRELRDQGAAKVTSSLDTWAAKLDPAKEADAHALLEAAWAREGVNAFSPTIWRKLWENSDARIRAAALRILSHRWKEFPDAMKVLAAAVADENAQVRLWAVAVLAEMRKPAAISLALKTLDQPMDESLDFLLELTCREQADVWMPAVVSGKMTMDDRPKHLVYAMKSTGRSDALPPLFTSLKEGKLSKEDAAAVLAMAGDAADMAQARVMADMVNDAAMAPHYIGLQDALVKAATDRKIIPEGAQDTVMAWFDRPEPHVVHRAAILAGLWKIEAARDKLVALLTDAKTIPAIRDGAMRGLTALGGVKTRDLFDKLFAESTDLGLKGLMIDGLTSVGPQMAARRAVDFLATADVQAAKPVLTAFLKNKQLPGVLAKELAGKTIPDLVAVEGIRMVTSRGIQGPLAEALKKAGNVKQMDKPLTADEMAAMVAKVKSQGDPARGEAVYRRQQLLCTTCHAIGESGGVLGPNLVSIGASAPVDYLIESLLEPSKKIKEGYHMVIVTKKDGGVVSGGLVNDGAEELTIRDPANQIVKVAKSAVASRQMSPVSMMPPGLTASLREDEFVDLVRFLSELGREGAYKTQPNRYVRTWKAMGKMEQKDVDHVRHVGSFALNDEKYPYPWQIAISQVNGDLPLADLPAAQRMYPWFPKIVQFGLKLDSAGKVKLGFSAVKGIVVAVDGTELKELAPQQDLELTAGTHRISVLITRDSGDLAAFRVEILDGAAVVVP
ncbi:MAG: HEAT repeat domain-containing protein [Prosthecobacter sp.]|jgi:putative heme-binding domain-containing protein|uniref:PVC-type heme-binding CxxCH protein n=1 Tax=Prosthecobacter sp. TaxID=1965333 RepID=UPI0019DB1A26|nr:PVC-type heme-binding CxxCH protein [Prosthecobacter sp.]MBE2286341.1 HEAT repeat domain-containing protein [Prosthecobacter sp.]